MKRLPCYLVWLGGCLAIFPGLAMGQTGKQAADEQTLRSLLAEVRELRLTLQRTSLIAYRSQITVERIRAQRERVDRLTRQLEDVRNEIEATAPEAQRLADRIKELESEAMEEPGSERRKLLDAESKDLKGVADVRKQRIAHLHERETQLAAQLNLERSKLDELDYRIESLDRELENEMKTQGSADKAQQDEKRP